MRTNWKRKYETERTAHEHLQDDCADYRETILNKAEELARLRVSVESLESELRSLKTSSRSYQTRIHFLESNEAHLIQRLRELQELPWTRNDKLTSTVVNRFGWVLYRMGILNIEWRTDGVFRHRWFTLVWKLDRNNGR